jgi:hypothetical protein
MTHLRRNHTHDQADGGVFKDWNENYRVVFELEASADPKVNRKMENFMWNFQPDVNIEDTPVVQWTSIGIEKAGMRSVDVLIGYAQQFQDQFNAEFN